MKINHKLIKNIIMGIGIGIFIISLFYKIRNLILYGGTSIADDEDENITTSEAQATPEEPKPAAGFPSSWGSVDEERKPDADNE
jgi:hypothetical protein